MNYKVYIFFILSIIVTACNKPNAPDFIKSTGEQTTETRFINSFSSIDLNGKITLYLISGNENKIEIKAGKNLIPKITTQVNQSVLTIDNNNTFNWVRSYKKDEISVYVYFTNLEKLIIKGENKIYSTDTVKINDFLIEIHSGITDINLTVNCNSLETVIHDGGGDIIINGKTNSLNTWNNGLAVVDYKNLETNYIYFVSKSQNKSFVKCNGNMNIDLYEYGNVYYYGSPTKITERNYSENAKLIKAD